MGKRYIIEKALNNNILQIRDGETEKIFIGRGIGFGKKPGELFEKNSVVDKVFVIEDDKNQNNFKQIFRGDGPEFVDFCEELILLIARSFHEELHETIHISLIDHISCTLRRLKLGEQIVNPFLNEIEALYDQEFQTAGEVCRRIEERYDVSMPEGEVGFIALHIHSARYNGELKNALRSNRICNRVITLLENETGRRIDKKSIDCVRFMVHLRYVIERTVRQEKIENELTDVIISKYKDSYELVLKIKVLLERELKTKNISREELAYLTMHVERLRKMQGR